MPKAPRSKRVVDPETGKTVVLGRAANGEPEPYFDKTRGVWVAPWRKADGRVGRPTGKTKAAAIASRDRHIEKAAIEAATTPDGLSPTTTLAEFVDWWLENVIRHRVRPSSLTTCTKQMRTVCASLGDVAVAELRAEQVAGFLSDVADRGTANHANNLRSTLAQVLREAENLAIVEGNAAAKVKPHRVPKVVRATLTPDEIRLLIRAVDRRAAAAVALCYVHGWRISEALGLAWQDLDLEERSVHVRRASTYRDGIGMILGPTKTARAGGRQALAPSAAELLLERRGIQDADRELVGEAWPEVVHEGERLELVFTSALGRPMLRQYVDKEIRKAAGKVGLDPARLGTHTGRRSVVTNLYAEGSFDLADVAGFVGHADVATTRGYVQHEGDRPAQVSARAFELLDVEAREKS